LRKYWVLIITSIVIIFTGCNQKKLNIVDYEISSKNMVQAFCQNNSDGNITPKKVELQFKANGFLITSNKNINNEYKRIFGSSDFHIYHILTLYRIDIIDLLLKDFPNSGILIPLKIAIYQKNSSKDINIAFLSAYGQAKTIGAKPNNKLLVNLEASIVDTIKEIMPKGKFVDFNYTSKANKNKILSLYKTEIDENNWNNDKDEIELNFEINLKNNKFTQTNFTDINFDLKQRENKNFDFYDIYSLCKLNILYHTTKSRPEAGAFVPCSLYMYKISKQNNLYVGFINAMNWITIFNIEDKQAISSIENSQKQMDKIITNLLY
jgi:uncharacterized protein (DUF302 family)